MLDPRLKTQPVNPTWQTGTLAAPRERASTWKQGSLLIGGILAMLIVVYLFISVAVNYAADKISDESESRLFSGYAEAFTKNGSPEGKKAVDFIRAEALFKRLISQGQLRRLNYQLHYDQSPLPNAFATPGGGVAVTAGLLDMVRSDTGLAMVLSHELGHHQGRHALRGMGRSLALSLVVGLIFGGDNALVASLLNLAEASHSRSQERDADAWGLKLVYRTMGTTDGAFEFFEGIEKDPRLRDSKLTAMLSSHPYTPDRIAAMRSLESKLLLKNPRKTEQTRRAPSQTPAE